MTKRSLPSQKPLEGLREPCSPWQNVTDGTPIKVKGKRGTWKFKGAEISDAGEVKWINAYGGTLYHEKMRAFSPDLVSVL